MREYIQAALKKVYSDFQAVQQQLSELRGSIRTMEKITPRSITAEIDAIPGRRLYYNLTGNIRFTAADVGRRGTPITMLVSQDGPFIQTHYPFVIWRPSEPVTATQLGLWRPVTPWPLPLQFTAAPVDGDTDIISLSYEVQDAGSQRNFQNQPVPPLFSRPDNVIPLPVPTLFTPNTSVQFTPLYQAILFNNGAVPPTAGILEVTLPGYRIANM